MLDGTRSDIDTALARLGEVGLAALDVAATISAGPAGASVRELPRISIDLSRTLQGKGGTDDRPLAVERDLEVIAPLGEGGMGRVLLARQHSLDREVAIKTLRGGASEGERAALIAEGAITGHLEHPSIIPVHALGLDGDGQPVLVMKRVDGVEWMRLIEGGREPLARHLEILIQVCNAVELAHSRHVVHRDIKPPNVLIGNYGDVYLCDWGLAVRTDRPWTPQPLCGTPGYMAPEMVLGGPVDERTDVYLLGATLHCVLTGAVRNAGEDPRAASLAAVEGEPYPYPPDVPDELAALANRATARDPAARPASVRELREALVGYLQHRSSLALAHSAAERVAELRGSGAALHDEDAQHRFERLSVEARFALDQALAQWSDNPVARQAARDLDAVLGARRARAAELERLARDLDPEALGPYRVLVFAALAVVGVGLAVVGIAMYPRQPSPAQLLYQSFAPLGLLLALAMVLRRRFLATAFNRRLLVAGLATIGGITVSRALELHAGMPTPAILLHDSLLSTVALAIAASFLFRWLAWLALLMLAAAVVAATSPAHAHVAFSIASGTTLSLMTVFGRRRRSGLIRSGRAAGRRADSRSRA